MSTARDEAIDALLDRGDRGSAAMARLVATDVGLAFTRWLQAEVEQGTDKVDLIHAAVVTAAANIAITLGAAGVPDDRGARSELYGHLAEWVREVLEGQVEDLIKRKAA